MSTPAKATPKAKKVAKTVKLSIPISPYESAFSAEEKAEFIIFLRKIYKGRPVSKDQLESAAVEHLELFTTLMNEKGLTAWEIKQVSDRYIVQNSVHPFLAQGASYYELKTHTAKKPTAKK